MLFLKNFQPYINIVLVTFVLLISSISLPARAILLDIPLPEPVNQSDQGEIREALKDISEVDPSLPDSEPLKQESLHQYQSEQGNTEVTIDILDKDISLQSEDKDKVIIRIPEEDGVVAVDVVDDKVVFTNDNQTKTVVEAVEGGMRQIITIESPNAPNTYDFPVELGEGDRLDLIDNSIPEELPEGLKTELDEISQQYTSLLDPEVFQPQGAIVRDSDGKTKLTIAPPWAKDNNGQDLKTWYTVENGNILRQHVEFDDSAAFPIVADPTWCGNLISNSWWHWDGGKYPWVLRNNPTWCGRNIAASSPAGRIGIINAVNWWIAGQGFAEVINKAPNHPAWDKRYGTSQYWSMYNQYVCHQFNVITSIKDTWNLEPNRPNVGLSLTYLNACNPR